MTIESIQNLVETPVEAFELRWLSTRQDIDTAAPLWRDLDRRSTADLVWFQSYEWCRSWMDHHMDAASTPKILMLVVNGRATAILPMMLRRARGGVKMLSILGEPHTQYANMLTEYGTLSCNEITAIRTALSTTTGVDAAVFNCVDCTSPLAAVLSEKTARHAMANEAAELDLTTLKGQPFEARLGKSKQRDMRRCARQLGGEAELTLEILRPGMADYRPTIQSLLKMKQQWLDATGKIGTGLMYQGHDLFLNTIAQSSDKQDGPYLFAMKAGAQTVAIELGFLQRGHYYAYMGGFDWSLRRFSPGKLQMCMTINALAKMGAKSYDLLANPTDYKKEYSDRNRALSGHIVNVTNKGALYTRYWTQGVLPLMRRAFYGLPDYARQRLTGLRQPGVARSV